MVSDTDSSDCLGLSSIVSYLYLNVIIHLEVKLNYEKILENGWISKGKRAPVISLIAKSKESDTVFMIKICM